MGNVINVYTDASFCQRRNIGSYAYVIEARGNTYEDKGLYPKKTRSITNCELWSIYQASCVATILNAGHNDTIIYWTDNFGVIKILGNVGRERSGLLKKLKDNILGINNSIDHQYCFNFIPRNSNPQMKKCDAMAKSVLRSL